MTQNGLIEIDAKSIIRSQRKCRHNEKFTDCRIWRLVFEVTAANYNSQPVQSRARMFSPSSLVKNVQEFKKNKLLTVENPPIIWRAQTIIALMKMQKMRRAITDLSFLNSLSLWLKSIKTWYYFFKLKWNLLICLIICLSSQLNCNLYFIYIDIKLKT